MPTESPTTYLEECYDDFLVDQDSAAFIQRIATRYTLGTLERLVQCGQRPRRRAAVLALGYLAGYEANEVLGRALRNNDRLTRNLAENAIRSIWLRAGNDRERQELAAIVRLNSMQQYKEALRRSNELVHAAPDLAEAWNQRAIAYYCLGRYVESINDCRQALELNAYHFGAAGGMGQCYVQLDDLPAALDCFRRALKMNPNLEGVRASVSYLERSLKRP
ncbi:MAG: tetratricopeptide repeat protein [Pirellulales bacterium]